MCTPCNFRLWVLALSSIIAVLHGSSTGAASLALGEAWESDQVSGHSGEMLRLNTGEYSYTF